MGTRCRLDKLLQNHAGFYKKLDLHSLFWSKIDILILNKHSLSKQSGLHISFSKVWLQAWQHAASLCAPLTHCTLAWLVIILLCNAINDK